MSSSFSMSDLNVIGSHVLVVLTICAIIVLEAMRPKNQEGRGSYDFLVPVVSIAGLALALVYLTFNWNASPKTAFSGLVVMDKMAVFFNAIILLATILTVMISMNYLAREQVRKGEFYVLLLGAAMGMMFLAATTNLLMIFLGIEIMSIAIYVLAGYVKRRLQCNEAALKYFLLGTFASAFLLFGMALLYGASGSLDLREIAKLSFSSSILVVAGFAMVLVGLAFKIAAFPFHMWTPDVYDGAPITVTGFMAVAVKAAAFAALLRFVLFMLPEGHVAGYQILAVLAVLTMTYANFAALAQKNIKRMLAYSSIAHTGYLLVGVTALFQSRDVGTAGIMYYLLAYAFMNIGAFGVVAYMARKDETAFDIENFSGLARRDGTLALAMAIFMFSLAGIPPLAGFFGKFYVFSAAVKANLIDLAIIGVLNSALSVYYYIRIVWYMYFREPEDGLPRIPSAGASRLALMVAVIFTILLGILPGLVVGLAQSSALEVVLGK